MLQLVSVLVLAVFVVNLGYGFEKPLCKLDEYEFVSRSLGGASDDIHATPAVGNRFAHTILAEVPVPLPKNYVLGIDRQKWDFERGLPSYLRGQWADHGWWYYYLYALAIKEPLGTWCLAGLAVGATLLHLWKRKVLPSCPSNEDAESTSCTTWRDGLVFARTRGWQFCSSVSSQPDAFRSIICGTSFPRYRFCSLWISKVGRVFEARPFMRKRLPMAGVVALLLAWSIGSSLATYPHSLSYFNELAAVLPLRPPMICTRRQLPRPMKAYFRGSSARDLATGRGICWTAISTGAKTCFTWKTGTSLIRKRDRSRSRISGSTR